MPCHATSLHLDHVYAEVDYYVAGGEVVLTGIRIAGGTDNIMALVFKLHPDYEQILKEEIAEARKEHPDPDAERKARAERELEGRHNGR
jgi:hypothetical protein